MKHEPLAYIRGKQEFYGREFYVSPDTLTPRPETETMIEMLLKLLNHERQLMNDEQLQIMDVGTGSGCIIITAALELCSKDIDYLGLDISAQALRIARDNARKFNVDVKFSKFDLTSDELPISTSATKIILANLPYVPNDFDINLAASHEPSFAIYGGTDGLDYYRVLFKQLKQPYPIFVFTESLPPQHSELKIIAENAGFELMDSQDLIQVFQKLI